MNRFYLICTFLCALFSHRLAAQSWQMAWQRADSLFAKQQYATAGIEYERTLFLLAEFPDLAVPADSVRLITQKILLQKTFCNKASRDFGAAQKTILRTDASNLPDAFAFRLRYEKALCAYLNQQYDEAQRQILQTRFLVKDTLMAQQLDWLEIVTLNELSRWDESRILYRQYIRRQNLPDTVNDHYLLAKRPKIRNPRKAGLLSTVMPGTGLLYAGSLREGIVSTTIQAGLLTFGVFSWINGYPISGFLTGGGLFQTFYFGGIKRAERVAEMNNRKKKENYNQKLKSAILNRERQRLR